MSGGELLEDFTILNSYFGVAPFLKTDIADLHSNAFRLQSSVNSRQHFKTTAASGALDGGHLFQERPTSFASVEK